MRSRGLTKEKIIKEAIAYIEKSGQSRISMHELARRLDIKTPSLYNHVQNSRDLRHQIFRYAITTAPITPMKRGLFFVRA